MRALLVLACIAGCQADFDRDRVAIGFGSTRGAADRPEGFEVCRVTSLADDGEGSLRACLVPGREVVFDVGGEIALRDWLDIPDYVTLRGETAPGGITLAALEDSGVISIEGRDVIVRNVRVRGAGFTSGARIALCGAERVILEHLVVHSARTGISIIGGSRDVTIRNSLFAELSSGINAHGTVGCESTRHERITVARNVFHRVNERAPRFAGGSQLQVVNNIVHGWHWFELGSAALALEDLNDNGVFPSQIDVVGNAFVGGPGEDDNAIGVAAGVTNVFAIENEVPPSEADLIGLGADPQTGVDFASTLERVLDTVGPSPLNDQERGWVTAVRGALSGAP
ncbi:MAG: hypothetical protein AAGE52_12200 [Myxococcota bacterium]